MQGLDPSANQRGGIMPFFSCYIIIFLMLPLKLLNDFSWHSYKLPFFQWHRRHSPKGSNRPLTFSCSLSYTQTHTHTLRTHEELSVVSGMFKVFNNFSPNLISSVLCFMFYILSLTTYHVINTYISVYHDYFFLLFLILLQITNYTHLSSGDSSRRLSYLGYKEIIYNVYLSLKCVSVVTFECGNVSSKTVTRNLFH